MEETGVDDYKIYRVKSLPKFESTYRSLIKTHYRKDKKGAKEFEKLVDNFIEELKINPCLDSVSDSLSFPSKTAEQGFEFRKKRWRKLPNLQGAARFGRLIYLVCHPKKIVYLIWIYTHQEFQAPHSQPPDKDLQVEVNLAKEQSRHEPDISDKDDDLLKNDG